MPQVESFLQQHVTLGERLLEETFVPDAACINVPDRPGLGIELGEPKLAARVFDDACEVSRFTADDGGIAEW
jgi:hypothetical protein